MKKILPKLKGLSRKEIQLKTGISEATFHRRVRTGEIRPLFAPIPSQDYKYEII